MVYFSYLLMAVGGILYVYVMCKAFSKFLQLRKVEQDAFKEYLSEKDKMLVNKAAILFAIGAIVFVIAAFYKAMESFQ